MTSFEQLDWATPWGSLLLAVPFVLALLAYRRRARLAAWAEPHLQPWAVAAKGSGERRNGRSHLAWLAWVLLALSAGGPRLPLDESADRAAARHAMSVLVALDVSASMAASDIAPDRLTRARLELADLAKRMEGERLGLLLYAGEAGLLLPPTDDANLFARALDQAGPDLIEAQGTNVAVALQLAAQTLGKERTASRAVLLVSDGEADSVSGPLAEHARKAAQSLKAAGIPLYVLVVSSEAGAAIPLPDGGFAEREGVQVASRPALDSYAEFARMTGGELAAAGDGDADWRRLYDGGIARLPGDAAAAETVRAWRMLHAWPLLGALLFFMLAWLPRAAPSAALLLALLLPAEHDAVAAEAERQAWHSYRSGQFNEAIRQYQKVGGHAGEMGAGAASWKLRDYAAAVRHFGAALLLARNDSERADALYNLGNAHFALARWQTAAESWRAVLQMRPADARAQRNLAEAERQLARHRHEPFKTDLRGRRGSIAEGEASSDWDTELAMPEFEAPEDSVLAEQGEAAGARLQGARTAGTSVSLDARRLQSGLRKLERLQEHPRTLLKGMLKQDSSGAAQEMELAPW
ncbi:MAG: VWA domain-containing protein [Pseudomonadota bacterium]